MAIVDCVVVDYHQLYLPEYFFELDSFYHDEPTQIRKDKYKNNIFSIAGQKLHRIRKIGNNITKVDFTRLIEEALAPLNDLLISFSDHFNCSYHKNQINFLKIVGFIVF